jgi:hypothetical protein
MGQAGGLPDYKQKQNFLFGKEIKTAELSRIGAMFVEAGWLNDAVDFFAKANDQTGLERVRQIAIEEGDVFLFRRVLKVSGATAEEAEWKAIGDRALQAEKLLFAREAFRMAGDRKSMDRIDSLMPPDEVSADGDDPADPEVSGEQSS